MGYWTSTSVDAFENDYFVKILYHVSENSQDFNMLKKVFDKDGAHKAVGLLQFLQRDSYDFANHPIICNKQMKISKGHEVVALAKKLGAEVSYMTSNKQKAFDYSEAWAQELLTRKEFKKLTEKQEKEEVIIEKEEEDELLDLINDKEETEEFDF